MIDITQPNMRLIHHNGNEISTHRSAVEAMERAAKEGPGTYTLVRPDATIVVSGEPVEPEPEPEPTPGPDPEPEPPPANLPQSIADAQAAGLLPYYRNLGYSVEPDTDINWTSTAGERDEIGCLPEQHAAYLAGQTDLESSILEAAMQPLPDSIAHSHMPNLHWLPLLLTGDKRFVEPMEEIYSRYMSWWQRREGGSFGSYPFGRALAWPLLNLAQLAWCEKQGLTEKKVYQSSMDANRDMFLAKMQDPMHDRWRVLAFNTVYWRSHGWTGWMEAFIGMVLCRIVHMGFEDWRPIAKWHYEQLELRSGIKWPLKGADSDSVSFIRFAEDTTGWGWKEMEAFAPTVTWEDAKPYTDAKMADPEYIAHPDDEVIFSRVSKAGNRFTFTNRTHGLHQWAVSAIGIDPRAEAKEKQLWDSIQRRGDSWEYRHSFRRA